MFIGHNAVAFASKRAAPRTSLGILTAAVMLPDLIWPIFLFLGIEHVRIEKGATKFTPLDFYDYPWTHSLLMSIAWGAAFGLVYWLCGGGRLRPPPSGRGRPLPHDGRGALLVGLGVVSHWVLDFIVHRPDLPLWPGGPKFGLGLWNWPAGTFLVEGAMFVAGVAIYLRCTRAHDRIGSIGFWSFVIVLVAIYISAAIGPPPPDWHVVATMAMTGWLLPFWAWWFDRHREAVV